MFEIAARLFKRGPPQSKKGTSAVDSQLLLHEKKGYLFLGFLRGSEGTSRLEPLLEWNALLEERLSVRLHPNSFAP